MAMPQGAMSAVEVVLIREGVEPAAGLSLVRQDGEMDRHSDAGRSRWDVLFEDLEAQLRAADELDLSADRAEHARSVRGEALLSDRLIVAAGAVVRVQVHGHGLVEGTVEAVGQGWFMLRGVDSGGGRSATAWATTRHWLIPDSAVLAVRGLERGADPHLSLSQRRLDIRSALRAISRDRLPVRIGLIDGGRLTGTIDRVGRDHVDLSEHPEDLARRAASVRQTVVVAVSAVGCVISAAERVRTDRQR